MRKAIALVLGSLCLGASAFAGPQDENGRWVTFKSGHNSQGSIEHQIDRRSIRQEGAYRTFWTRLWLTQQRQPLVFTQNEQIGFWSQKFAVGCKGRRFGGHFIDSNNPGDIKVKAAVQTLRWQSLEKVPAVGRAVCGDK
jgi:hypothetical protein